MFEYLAFGGIFFFFIPPFFIARALYAKSLERKGDQYSRLADKIEAGPWEKGKIDKWGEANSMAISYYARAESASSRFLFWLE